MTSTSNSNIVIKTIKIVECSMLVSYHIFVSHYSISDLTVVIFPKIRDTTEQGVFMGQKDLSEKILVAYDDVFADIVNTI